jgi:AraC-like DNA-binding protein
LFNVSKQDSESPGGGIVKMRMARPGPIEFFKTQRRTMSKLPTVDERPKGVVDPATARKMFRLERYLPPAGLAPFLDHYWLVEWDLRGKPDYMQRTLPYPCVHVVFGGGRRGVFGVPTGAFDYVLKDSGKVLGLRFRPGAFRSFLDRPAHTLADQVLALSKVFPVDDDDAESAVLAAPDDAAMIAVANELLFPRLPQPDPQVERIAKILRIAEQSPGLTQVDLLAAEAGIGVRALQQLFSDYVGVSPKWVIRRYRLHEAADRLANGEDVDLATLAANLGYFDQAHFTSDFRRLVGQPPAQYRQAVHASERGDGDG